MNPMKKYLLLICSILIANIAFSQTFTIKGILANDSTKETEPFATFKVYKKNAPNTVIKVFASDENGKFQEKVPGSGEFILTVSSLGFQQLKKDLKVNENQKIVNLDTVYIKPASTLLQGVEIVAQKPLIKSDLDKIEYNIEEDPDSKTNTVIEMLRKVPLVTVDGQDNIQVKGSSNFKIYVDGKPNNMLSKNASDVLKSMPATSIKKIEVITDPGAKYDAEGVGGILNIVTNKKVSMDGYTATLTARGSTKSVGAGVFAMFNKDKFTMSLRYNYNYRSEPEYKSDGYRRTTGDISQSSYDMDYWGKGKNKGTMQWGNLDASYDIDSLQLISASFGLWGGGNDNNSNNFNNAFVPQQPNNTLYKYNLLNNSKNTWYSIEGKIDYQRLFSVKDRMLTFSYNISSDPSTSNSYTDYVVDEDYNPYWETFIESLKNQHNKGSQSTLENTFQADFSTPIKKIHTIEVGAKYILRNNNSNNDKYVENSSDEYVFDENNSMHYRHTNNILGTYASYNAKIKKFSAKAGVRYEYTYQTVKYELGHGENFNTHFNDVVPSVTFGWQASDKSNFKLGYNMRIQRPGIWSLNPYLDDSNPLNISQGNPNLESEKSNSFNIGYNLFSQKINLSGSVSYSFTNNGIQSITKLINDKDIPGLQNPTDKDVLYTTYYNSGKSKNLNFNAYVNWNITKSTRLFTNLSTTYVDLKGDNNITNNGWKFNSYTGIQQSFNHDWVLSGGVFATTKDIDLQSNRNGMLFYNLSLNKSFLKKKLTISLSAQNFCDKYFNFKTTSYGTGYYQYDSSHFVVRDFRISVSYKIGELKAQVKKAARTISNDDVKAKASDNKSSE